MKSLAEQIDDPALEDFDLESHDVFAQHNSEDEVPANQDARRDHYEAVEKSKLRRPVQPELGKQYQASPVTRDALDAVELDDDDDPFAAGSEENDDPFARAPDISNSGESEASEVNNNELNVDGLNTESAEEDEEIDSDEAFDEDDYQNFHDFKFRGSKSRKLENVSGVDGFDVRTDPGSEDDDIRDVDAEIIAEDSDLELIDDASENSNQTHGSDASDSSDHSDTSTSSKTGSIPDIEPKSAGQSQSADRNAVRELLAKSTSNLASTLSAAAASDARKGRAVKRQYETFDRLLDLRIKLQKALTATESLQFQDKLSEDTRSATQHAESAALNILNTITTLRASFLNAQSDLASTTAATNDADEPSKRRKFTSPTPASQITPSKTVLSHSITLHKSALPHRRSTLQKWSNRVHATSLSASNINRGTALLPQNEPSNILSNIDTHLATASDRMVTESTHPTPSRPNPETDSTSSLTPNPLHYYTDTPFYTSLLRDLISHRTTSSPVVLPTRLPKVKTKTVDTKASKGRKVRYHVHEKLLNFTASGDERGTWTEGAARELFGSLFGGRGLREDDEEEGGGGQLEDGVEDGFRIF